jgi:hypothetical protein
LTGAPDAFGRLSGEKCQRLAMSLWIDQRKRDDCPADGEAAN